MGTTWDWQIISDIHLEFYDKHDKGIIHPEVYLKPGLAPNLALCGDIGNPRRPAYKSFLEWCSINYESVFVVSGNHEYYTFGKEEPKTDTEIDSIIEDICSKFPNVFFLQKAARQMSQGRVLGCTLWTSIPPHNKREAERVMNDYKYIHEWSVDAMRKRYTDHVSWLTTQIEHSKKYSEPTVILTHHLPSFHLIHEDYKNNPMNYNFASDLDDLIHEPIEAWFCGHSHKQNHVINNGVHCVINPFGYPNENDTRDIRNKVVICHPRKLGDAPPPEPEKRTPELPKTSPKSPFQNGRPRTGSARLSSRKPSEDLDFI